ncbi:hypothetical protein CAPTEDRAFT_189747 [Capitella teleta]|uniref:RRM domain-containing protein n=1 Tax=Capitella teleta TaxID=283909 RepID=R7U8U8_CAPTE|nr:hypothetical protein CAPTEDRAFT_189747 [Capitella teleta]|eukprot:ELU00122.1 hypothetical protein CAPTEDRAFT_189747 [Capitella teleta]
MAKEIFCSIFTRERAIEKEQNFVKEFERRISNKKLRIESYWQSTKPRDVFFVDQCKKSEYIMFLISGEVKDDEEFHNYRRKAQAWHDENKIKFVPVGFVGVCESDLSEMGMSHYNLITFGNNDDERSWKQLMEELSPCCHHSMQYFDNPTSRFESMRRVEEEIPVADQLTEEIPAGSHADNEVCVIGIDDSLDEQMIEEILISDEALSLEGPIRQIKINKAKGAAMITFNSSSDAAQVLEHKIFGDNGQNAFIVSHVEHNSDRQNAICGTPKSAGVMHSPMPNETQKKDNLSRTPGASLCAVDNAPVEPVDPDEATPEYKILSVAGFSADKDTLKLKFEHMLSPKGIEIEEVEDADEGFHSIKFSTEIDTLNAHKRALEKGITWKEHTLTVALLEPLQGNPQSHAVLVEDLDPAVMSEEILKFYFENKSSNGGPVRSTVVREDGKSAVVCFHEFDAAERVVMKESHVLTNTRLKVTPLRAPPPPALTEGDVEPLSLLLGGVPWSANAEKIQDFVEKAAKSKLKQITFAANPGKVILLFEDEPHFSALLGHCIRYPLVDSMVRLERIPQSKSIQVVLPGFHSDHLGLYFESNKRSGGGDVESVEDCKQYTIINFEEKNTLDCVLTRDHTVAGQKPLIRKYFACLGFLPPDHDDSQPVGPMPSDIKIDQLHPSVLAFLLQAKNLRQHIEVELEAVGCQIAWPEESIKPLFLRCTLDRNADAFYRESREWQDKVNGILDRILSKIASDKVTVGCEIWEKIKTDISGVAGKQDSEKLFITLSESTFSFTISGEISSVEKVLYNIQEKVKVCEFSNRIINDKIPVEERWQNHAVYKWALDGARRKYPAMKIEMASLNTLSFEGCYADIQEAKEYIQRFLHNIPQGDFTVSETTKKLMAKPGSKGKIWEIFRTLKGKHFFYDSHCKDNYVRIYSTNESDLEIAIKAIQLFIKEHKFTLTTETQEFLSKISSLPKRFNRKFSYMIWDNILHMSVITDVEADLLSKLEFTYR